MLKWLIERDVAGHHLRAAAPRARGRRAKPLTSRLASMPSAAAARRPAGRAPAGAPRAAAEARHRRHRALHDEDADDEGDHRRRSTSASGRGHVRRRPAPAARRAPSRSARTRRRAPRPPARAPARRDAGRSTTTKPITEAGEASRGSGGAAPHRRPAPAQTPFEQAVEVEGRAHADVGAVLAPEGLGRAPALVAQHGQERPLGVELRGIAELGHDRRCGCGACASPAQRAPSPLPASTTWRSTAIIRSSLSSTALNETSFIRLAISRAVRGGSGRSAGLIWTRKVSCDVASRGPAASASGCR